MAVIGNAPFQGLVSGGEILDASIEGVDLSTSAIAARLGYTPVNPGAAAITAGSINNTTIGATTASTGAFTTLTNNAATTFTAGTASTTTGTGTLVITGGLGVSGRINAANFDGIVGANTAAAGSFTTIGATGATTLATTSVFGGAGTAAGLTALTVGDATNATFRMAFTNGPLIQVATNATVTLAFGAKESSAGAFTQWAALSSTGLAVTGILSAQSNNTHAGGSTFDSTGTTQLWLRDTDATVNTRNWGFQVSGGDFNILRANDDKASGFVTPITMGQAPANSLVILSSGNIGIGTSSPTSKLYISHTNYAGDPYCGLYVKNTDTTGTAYTGIALDGYLQSHTRYLLNGVLKWQIRVGNGAGTDLFQIYSWTLGADALTIDNTGKVGIGTSTNTLYAKLHVLGSTGGILESYASGRSAPGAALMIVDGGYGSTTGVASLALSGGLGNNGTMTGWVISSKNTGGAGAPAPYLAFSALTPTTGGSSTQTAISTEYARFNEGGLFGIGTSSPQAKLHVFQRSDAGAAPSTPEIRIEHQDINAIGTGGSNGGVLSFVNIQRDNTAWAADKIWGRINFYGSQPTSGVAQLGASILAAADGAIGGLQSASYLAFHTSDYTNGGNTGEKMRISADGVLNVGLSTGTIGDGKLIVAATGSGAGTTNTRLFMSGYELTSGNAAGLWFGARNNENTGVIGSRTATGNIAFETYNGGWGERVRITYVGNLLVGTTSAPVGGANSAWANPGSTVFSMGPNGGNAFVLYNPSSVGCYVVGGQTGWTGTSDGTLKNVIAKINNGLSSINELNPIIYSWKSDEANTPYAGLIAQEVQSVLPDLVNDNNGTLGVNYTGVIPYLISAIQEQQALIQQLTARLDAANL